MSIAATIGFAILLALLGAYVVVRAVGTPWRGKRALTGLALVSCAGACVWLHVGGSLRQPRAIVIVFSDTIRGEDLELAVASLGEWDRVAWLRLSDASGAQSAAPTWMSSAQATRQADEPGQDYLGRIRDAAPVVSGSGDDWLKNLVEGDRAARRSLDGPLPNSFYRDGLLVIHDTGPTWENLQLGPLGNLGAVVAELQDPPTDVFVMDAPSNSRPGRLEIELDRSILSARAISELGSTNATLKLIGAESVRQTSGKYKLRAFLDGDSTTQRRHFVLSERTLSDPDRTKPEVGEFQLTQLEEKPNNDDLSLLPGFHRLLVELTIPTQRNEVAVELTYSAVKYILVDDYNLLILHPDGTLGELARESWFPQALGLSSSQRATYTPPTTPLNLYLDFLKKKDANLQRSRVSLSPKDVQSVALPAADPLPAATIATVRTRLAQSRILVLVELTYSQLMQLTNDADLKLVDQIESGLTVLVIGPPPYQAPWPAWLPYSAKAGAAKVHRDRRLYFCPDNSRLMKFQLHDPRLGSEGAITSADLTPLRAQAQVINEIVSRLGARDRDASGPTPLVKVIEKPHYHYMSVLGNARPRRGQVPGVDPSIPVPIDVYPPFSHFLHIENSSDLQTDHVWLWETAPSFLPQRLRALETGIPNLVEEFRPLDKSAIHPGSSVVLFVADLPQPKQLVDPPGGSLSANMHVVTVGPPVKRIDAGPDLALVKQLTTRGVTVYVVPIRFAEYIRKAIGANFSSAAGNQASVEDYLSDVKNDPVLKRFLVELPPLDFDSEGEICKARASVTTVVDTLVAGLRSQSAGEMNHLRTGRVIDERTLARRDPPETHTLIQLIPDLQAEQDLVLENHHARILDSRFPPVGPGLAQEEPLIGARLLREGRVIVMAYSPFAADVWQPDAESARVENTPAPIRTIDGWGVQRLIDLSELTTPRQSLPEEYPVVRGVREAPDGATLFVDCWTPLTGPGAALPTLEPLSGAGDPVPGQLESVDHLTQSATFQFRSKGPLKGECRLRFVVGNNDQANPSIHLDLKPASIAGRSVKEGLARLARRTGGRVINSANAAESLRFYQPIPWLVGFLLVGLTMLLFSPLLRPWSFLRRKRSRGSLDVGDTKPVAQFDVDAVLTDWGLHSGEPRSARQAGLPGGQKPFESGDSLSNALPASLFAFTTYGRMARLPQRRPIVKRRHVTRAMEAVLLVDCTPGLLVSQERPNKEDYLALIVRLLVGAVWATAGTVRVASIQRPTEVWGPRGQGDDSEELQTFLRLRLAEARGLRDAGPIQLPEDLSTGHVLFLLSDLLAPRENDLRKVSEFCAGEAVEFRVVHLRGAADIDLVGLARSPLSGALLDRSEWTSADLLAAFQAHAAACREIVEAGGGRFITATTDLTVGDLFESFLKQEFLK